VAPLNAVLASQNAHKLEELRSSLSGWSLELADVRDYPPEDGASYEANARIKARAARAAAPADAWVLGEDSGIEADALDGAPGIHSARWANGGDVVDVLLQHLALHEDRRGRMVTEIVALGPRGEEVHVRGVLEGEILPARRGEGGFGYDPVFLPRGETQTVAELGDEWKRANSHRARAAHALAVSVEES